MVGIRRRHCVRPRNSTLALQPNTHENMGMSWLLKEEYEVEKEIMGIIRSGNTDLLKPNCPNGITIREHPICVLLHEQEDPEFRVWEWHGHIMIYDPQSGSYRLEYIHGHYCERLIDEIPEAVDQNLNDDSPRFA